MTQNHGLFVGGTTLDCIYQADHPPAANEKVVAAKSLMVAGGPATNAAVAFAQLMRSNKAALHSVIGSHGLTGLIKEDLLSQGVTLSDLESERLLPPAVSSIVVSAKTGERAVISRSAADAQVAADAVSPDILSGVNIVLIDGHQMAASAQIAQWAKEKNIPVIVDAGSWKPGFETVLPLAEAVIASANFFPPGCETVDGVIRYLSDLGIAKIAITRGAQPILFVEGENTANMEVPKVKAVDTLGAGDIFHGSFCHFYLTHTFEESLLKASRTSSFACQHWGTRDWTKIYRIDIDDEDDEDGAN